MNIERGNYPMEFISDFIIHNKYASYKADLKRRQTWDEAIGELEQMQIQRYPGLADEIVKNFKYVYNKTVMPSMRSVQFGGRPIEYNNARMYNCCFSPIDHPAFFPEIAFLLMSGCGPGYSVRKYHVNQLPIVVQPSGTQKFLISDTSEGIADSFKALIKAYLNGKPLPRFDYSDIRKKGSIIKKSGHTAPGPERTAKAHAFVSNVLKRAIGRKLTPLECLDISNYIGDSIVSGGVREAAMISLCDKDEFDVITCKGIYKIHSAKISATTPTGWMIKYKFVEDQIMNTNTYTDPDNEGFYSVFITNKFGEWDMQQAIKEGQLPWYYVHPQRGKSNNSVNLSRLTTSWSEFSHIMFLCKESKAGEPGAYWNNDDDEWGVNPCNEAALRRNQFCNLTTQNVFYIESQQQLNEQSKAASFIGSLQAGWTDLHYLRPIWKQNTDRDALIGVSMTGVASGNVLKYNLREAAQIVLKENERISGKIGTNLSARSTLIKPEGSTTNVMKILGSGMHAAHASYILKSFRVKKHNAIYGYLVDKMPSQFIEDEFNNETEGAVVYVPLKADMNGHGIYRDEPIGNFLGRIKHFYDEWIVPGHRDGVNTHNVSATVSVGDDEWDQLTKWMWDNKDHYNGISCLPRSNHNYKQAPFQEITESEYNKLASEFPSNINFTEITEDYGSDHATDNLACAGGACAV